MRLYWAVRAADDNILRTISCAAGAAAYNIFSENTTKTIAKFRDERAETSRGLRARHGSPHFRRFRALRHQAQPRRGGPRRALYVFDDTAEAVALRVAEADGRVEDLLGYFDHAVEERAAARQNHSARKLPLPSGLAYLVGDVRQNFFGARLKYVAQYLARELSRRTTADGRHFDEFAPLRLAQTQSARA